MATVPVFDEAIRRVFSNWTLLRLAVDQGWGGRNSNQKANQLQLEIVERLAEGARRKRVPSYTNESDVQDLADYIFRRLDELFNTEADDGSEEEIAAICLRLHNTCSQGDMSFAQTFVEKCPQNGTDISKCQGVDGIQYATEEDQLLDQMQGMDLDDELNEADEVDDDSMDDGTPDLPQQSCVPDQRKNHESAGPDTGNSNVQAPRRVEPVVDDDGFTSVVKGGRRKPR